MLIVTYLSVMETVWFLWRRLVSRGKLFTVYLPDNELSLKRV